MAALGFTTTGRYRLLEVDGLAGSRLALEDEVQPAPTGRGETPFALTEAAVRVGDRRLVWRDASYPHAALHTFLGRWIYRDHDARGRSLRPALLGRPRRAASRACWSRCRRTSRARANGDRGDGSRGPSSSPSRGSIGAYRADGIGFVQPRAHVRPTALGARPARARVEPLPHHGRLRHRQVRADPAAVARRSRRAARPRSSTTRRSNTPPQFYTPERGDVILNPLDARSPYWSPGDEWRHEAETLTLATSLFPDRHHENAFFTEAPRRIFAHLLTLRPTPEQLAWWLCHEDEIDRRLAGTAYAADDRPAGAGPAQRRARLAQHGGGHAQAAARRNATRRAAGAPRPGRTRGRTAGSSSPARRRRARASCRSRACGWTRWCCG